MIPKIIHYCWFGGNPLPQAVKDCISSWKKYCPDYEIKEWNESNFDFSGSAYCREAYETKKWAFVADYVRLAVLEQYGGIYMDTDVEVVKSFDPLLCHGGFLCFESNENISIGTFGAENGSPLVKDMIDCYADRHFIKADGSQDLTTNLAIITPLLVRRYGLKQNGRRQILRGDILVLPMESFIAKSMYTGWIMRDETTFAIHHYAGSWVNLDSREKERLELRNQILRSYMKKAEHPLLAVANCMAIYKIYGAKKVMGKAAKKMIRKMGGGR